jgi:hypothetical protein
MSLNDSRPTQRTDPNAWGTDPCASKNPPQHHVFTPAELFKIVRAPPVEASSTSKILDALKNRSRKWIVWHIQSQDLEERHEIPKVATEEKNQHLVVVFLLDDKGYLRLQETNWGKDSSGKHIILTEKGWKYGKVDEAAAINVGEGFEFKGDEERLKQTLVGVWDVDGGKCFKDAEY